MSLGQFLRASQPGKTGVDGIYTESFSKTRPSGRVVLCRRPSPGLRVPAPVGHCRRTIVWPWPPQRFLVPLLPLLAAHLDLPTDVFDTAFAESQFSFRLTHYPPVAAEPNQFGIAPHTDANFMTFLAQSDVPGLQIRMPDGRWLDVPYVPGSFAVNSGDMMQRWTNHRFKSTPHRALPPVGRPRYAIPYFLGPHLDTEIACLPTCHGQGNPPRYPPISYAQYLEWWYDANYNAARQRDVA